MWFCVPVSTHVCLCAYVHGYAHAHTCVRACLRVCTNALAGVHTCVCVCARGRARAWERARVCACGCICTCVSWVGACQHMRVPLACGVRVHTRVYTSAQACVCVLGQEGPPPIAVAPTGGGDSVPGHAGCQQTRVSTSPLTPPSPPDRPTPPPASATHPGDGLGRGPRGRASHGRAGRRVPLPTAPSGQRGRSPGRPRPQPGLSPPVAPVSRRTRLRRFPGPGPCALVCCHLVLAHGRAPVPARGERREPIARGLWARRGGQCPGSGCRGEATCEPG